MKKNIKHIGVIGHFGLGEELTNGQTIKTIIVTEALKKKYPDRQIMIRDTHGGAKALFSLPFQALHLLRRTEHIVIFPAQRGLLVIVPLLTFLNRFYHRRLHYCVIGGWLPELLQRRRSLIGRLRRFTGVYVETATMKRALESLRLTNVFVVPNCKNLQPVAADALPLTAQTPCRLCIFSRIMQEKGIEDAIQALRQVNETKGKTVLTLDIFGQVDAAQTEWFEALKARFPAYVRYGGVVPFDQSTAVLGEYSALLFPTRFYTEGIPGTIIDAYTAGLPVIASRWQSFDDLIEEEVTGVGYPFGDLQGLIAVLSDICDHPQRLSGMKANCVKRAARYLPENALQPLFDQIGE